MYYVCLIIKLHNGTRNQSRMNRLNTTNCYVVKKQVKVMVKAVKLKHSPRPAFTYLRKRPLLAVTVAVKQ